MTSLVGFGSLFSNLARAQEYDSSKTIQFARALESHGFNLEGYFLGKPIQIQIDRNDSSVVIDCPLLAEKSNNGPLMDYPLFVAFDKDDSTNRFYRRFINSYGGLGFILDNNSISPEVYADSVKNLLKSTATSVKDNKTSDLESKLYEAYPNPSNGLVNVKYNIKNASDVTFGLYDLLGRKIAGFSERVSSGEHHKTFNTVRLSAGIYFLHAVFDSDGKKAVSTKRIRVVK